MANILSPRASTDVVTGGRFGRNGTDPSSAFSSNGDYPPTPRPRWAGGLARFWDRHVPFKNPFWAKSDSDAIDDDDANGVYAITKKTDYWFNREISQLEQQAKQLAAEWAEKGLPRHDMERSGVFEPEQVLGMKCLDLFRQWRTRVRTKMQDQIQAGSAALNRSIAHARSEVNALETTAEERKNTRAQIDTLQQFKESTPNFPVFRLLLPMDATLVQLASTLGEAAESHTWLAGPLVLFQDILLHFEAFLVALIAVLILVLLGKTTGSSARTIVAFRASESPMAATRRRFRHRAARDRVGAVVHVLLARPDRRDRAVARARRQCRARGSAVATAGGGERSCQGAGRGAAGKGRHAHAATASRRCCLRRDRPADQQRDRVAQRGARTRGDDAGLHLQEGRPDRKAGRASLAQASSRQVPVTRA